MLRIAILVTIFLLAAPLAGQSPQGEGAQALSFNRSISVPLNAVRLYDLASEAWTWTFGKEPGAVLRRADRDQGVIEGQARVNFRSAMLLLREESMGTVQYRVTIQVRAGECRVQVSELSHTGNLAAQRGGMHLGTLTTGDLPAQRVSGMSRANAGRLHAELKGTAKDRIDQLLQTFEWRLRAGVGP